MNHKPNTEIVQICVVADSPGCNLAKEWRKAFCDLPLGAFAIDWMYLSRPFEFWRKRNSLLFSGKPVQVLTLGWFSTVVSHYLLPSNISQIPTTPLSQDSLFIAPIVKRCTAQIRLPSIPAKRNDSVLVPPGFQLVCFADMVAGSGAMEVLWAFTMVRLAGWPCTLWMAGEGPLLEEFRSFANLASIPEDIRFVPNFRSENSLPANPDVVLLPSTDLLLEDLPYMDSSKTRITSRNSEPPGKTDAITTTKTNLFSIPWKPHQICRVIMDCLSQMKFPNTQPPIEADGKDLEAVLLAAARKNRLARQGLGS